ncbi:PREDICTED: tudor domain-containing protein 5-like isoform X3 [Wasmannia auropunctata]|uniref:tudor domain-containing protein 5-like isoform X3 n=1 Tax=Wasmannia auropunctata TaxID=64793 RepID=UPI0005EE3D22|nr:PREDICTED: tudor domain-containing protein 5-like isoform X3 [Wasmannia auropunctata]
MEKRQTLDDVRTLILSLLISRKDPLSVARLDRDYYEQEKTRIPYRQFGFATLLEFLQSMPDQFKIEQYNGSHYVRGIASDKSKHVSSLVARQKRPTNARNPPRFLPPHLRQSSSSTFNRHPQHTRHQPVIISHDKLLLLVQYIQSNPNGVGMDRAVKFAQKLVPYTNLSEQDLRAQLRELPHQVHLQGSMVYPAQNNDLQDSAAYSQPMKVPVREEPQSWNKPESSSDVASPLNAQNVFVAGEEDQDWIECSSDENDFIPAGCNPGSNYKKRVKTSELLETNIAQHMKYEQTDMYKLKNNLENGDDMYKAKNDLEDDDYSITINSSKSNTGTKDIKLLDLSEIISDRTKLRLEKLLEKHPDGIWCADLPDIYLNEYKVPLSYTDLGFTSVREFTSHLPKIFYMTQVHKTSDFLLYSADKRPVVPKTDSIDIAQASNTHTLHNKYDEHSSDMQAHCRNAEDDPIPSEVSPTITRKFAPNDVMNYGDKVGKISVTELQQITLQHKTFLEVYVCEVFNPSFFWIHLRKNKIQFQKLMSDIHDFYSDESNQSSYTIAKIALKKDLNCACIYLNNWHRGIIKSVKPDFRITVFFYDFGTLKTYAPEEVFYLHKKFAYLPAQAIPCSLYNVKPIVGDRWKKSVCGQFIDKISESLLVASIISVDAVNNSMVVVLTDTTEEEDVRINNWLVNERLAQVGQMMLRNRFVDAKSPSAESPSAKSSSAKSLDISTFSDTNSLNAQSRNCPQNQKSETPTKSALEKLKMSNLNERSNSGLSTSMSEASIDNESNSSGKMKSRANGEKGFVYMNFSPRDSDDEIGKNDFGEFRSLYGGRGDMGHIPWSVIREEKNVCNGTTATLPNNLDRSIEERESDVEDRLHNHKRNEVPGKQYFLKMTSMEKENFIPENNVDYDGENTSDFVERLKDSMRNSTPNHTITVWFRQNQKLKTPHDNDQSEHTSNSNANIELNGVAPSRVMNRKVERNDTACKTKADRNIMNGNSSTDSETALPNNKDNLNGEKSEGNLNSSFESTGDRVNNSRYKTLLEKIRRRQKDLMNSSLVNTSNSSSSEQIRSSSCSNNTSTDTIISSNDEQSKASNKTDTSTCKKYNPIKELAISDDLSDKQTDSTLTEFNSDSKKTNDLLLLETDFTASNIDDTKQRQLNESLETDSIASNDDTKQHQSNRSLDSIASCNVDGSNSQVTVVNQTVNVPKLMQEMLKQQIFKMAQNIRSNTELDSDDLTSSQESLINDKSDESKGDDELDCMSKTCKSMSDDANVTEIAVAPPVFNDCNVESDDCTWDAGSINLNSD